MFDFTMTWSGHRCNTRIYWKLFSIMSSILLCSSLYCYFTPSSHCSLENFTCLYVLNEKYWEFSKTKKSRWKILFWKHTWFFFFCIFILLLKLFSSKKKSREVSFTTANQKPTVLSSVKMFFWPIHLTSQNPSQWF